MRVPETPPQLSFDRIPEILRKVLRPGSSRLPIGRLEDTFLHWDEFRRRPPPEGLSHEEWWLLLKLQREQDRKPLPLKDKSGKRFSYCLPHAAQEILHRLDKEAGGNIQAPEAVTNPATRDMYVLRSLSEESIHSSLIEGAATTRKAAREMLRTRRKPQSKGEQMVVNNFLAMEQIRELRLEALTPETILELHRVLTRDTLDEPAESGRLRTDSDNVRVEDEEGGILHVPPPASELPSRLKQLCTFANEESRTPTGFLHPVIRAIALHFWLAYDHPFVDGNGRCARALFYWLMLRNDYWLFEFLSISKVVYRARRQYYRAFLHTETDSNDLTYFLLYNFKVIWKSIEELRGQLERNTQEVRRVERLLHDSDRLNHRQKELLRHALRHPLQTYSIEGHKGSHGVVYQTARTDLLELSDLGLLTKAKRGRALAFRPEPNLEHKLRGLHRL